MRLRLWATITLVCLGACSSANEAPPTASEQPRAVISTATPFIPTGTAPTNTPANVTDGNACPAYVTEALDTIKTTCDSTQRNQVCYSNRLVNVEFRADSAAEKFNVPGDIIGLNSVKSLTVEADLQNEAWGVALMRLQANLPDSLPGQNVTVLLFGDTEFSEQGAQSYYFKSGVGKIDCEGAPASGILVQTPEGATQVSFTLNGAEINLGSTAYIQANTNENMTISVVEGRAIVTAKNETQVVLAGTFTRVPLDGDGIAKDVPTIPEPYTPDALQDLPLSGLERDIQIEDPLNLSLPENVGFVQARDQDGAPVSVIMVARAEGSQQWIGSTVNGYMTLPEGNYDIQVETNPPSLQKVKVIAGTVTSLPIEQAGGVQVVDTTGAIIPILVSAEDEAGNTIAVSSDGQLRLLAGTYQVRVFTEPQTLETVTVTSGEVSIVTIGIDGTIQVVDVNGQPVEILMSVTDAQSGASITATSDGKATVLPGDYTVTIFTQPQIQQTVTVKASQTVQIPIIQSGILQLVDEQGKLYPILMSVETTDGTSVTASSEGETELLEGEYVVTIFTQPQQKVAFSIQPNETTQVTVSAPGTLQLVNASGALQTVLITVYSMQGEYVATNLEGETTLQSGRYRVEIGTNPKITQDVSITSGQTSTITIPDRGTVQLVDAKNNTVTLLATVYTSDGTYITSSSTGVMALLPDTYTIEVSDSTRKFSVTVTVNANETATINVDTPRR